MQIHELNNFTGTLGSGAYLAVDDGNDTGKLSTQQLLAATEARIDNIIAGPAPSAEEIVDARLGDDGVTYPSLGDAIRDQVGDLKSAFSANFANLSDGYDNNVLFGKYLQHGGYYNTDGTFVANNDYYYTDFIPAEGSTRYYTKDTGTFFLCMYDENKTFILGAPIVGGNYFASAVNCRYFKVSLYKTRIGTAKIYGNSEYAIYGKIAYEQAIRHGLKFSGSIDCNAQKNSVLVFNVSATLTNAPSNFTDWQDGANWLLITNGPLEYPDGGYIYVQTIVRADFKAGKRTASRIWLGGVWQSWYITEGAYTPKEFHVGVGQQYTRLRDGIAAGVSAGNAKVYVHAGTYNLIEEFASEIQTASGGTGIALGNNVHVIFLDGAKVTANFDNSESTYDATTWRWIYDSFQPFYSLVEGNVDFTIENLEIEASNTRYCVHDELGGTNTYRHEYKNCKMKYVNNHQDINYVQCIGGGLGKHGTIIIDGGYYECETDYGYASVGGDAINSQQCISYHNGETSGCDSSITIKNVYLADRGYFRFGYYGASTIKSNIYISGCETGLPTLKKGENSGAAIDNFEVIEWNANKRVPAHWQLTSSYQAILVND